MCVYFALLLRFRAPSLIDQRTSFFRSYWSCGSQTALSHTTNTTTVDADLFLPLGHRSPHSRLQSHKQVNLRVGSQWRVRLHLCPTLAWLAPVLLEEGNIEVYIMAARSIRTLGAMWRWIPFDDLTITGSVLALDADDINTGFSNWNAVESWTRSTQGFIRWIHAWKCVALRSAALHCTVLRCVASGSLCNAAPHHAYPLPLSFVALRCVWSRPMSDCSLLDTSS